MSKENVYKVALFPYLIISLSCVHICVRACCTAYYCYVDVESIHLNVFIFFQTVEVIHVFCLLPEPSDCNICMTAPMCPSEYILSRHIL